MRQLPQAEGWDITVFQHWGSITDPVRHALKRTEGKWNPMLFSRIIDELDYDDHSRLSHPYASVINACLIASISACDHARLEQSTHGSTSAGLKPSL